MSDIVTRLRLMEADELGSGSGSMMRLYGDAANEIQRLRQEVERLEKKIKRGKKDKAK